MNLDGETGMIKTKDIVDGIGVKTGDIIHNISEITKNILDNIPGNSFIKSKYIEIQDHVQLKAMKLLDTKYTPQKLKNISHQLGEYRKSNKVIFNQLSTREQNIERIRLLSSVIFILPGSLLLLAILPEKLLSKPAKDLRSKGVKNIKQTWGRFKENF